MLLNVDITEAEARNMAVGSVSERLKAEARKLLLEASKASEYEFVEHTPASNPAYRVAFKGEPIGIAYRYNRYWQIYIPKINKRIRAPTWTELQRRLIVAWEAER